MWIRNPDLTCNKTCYTKSFDHLNRSMGNVVYWFECTLSRLLDVIETRQTLHQRTHDHRFNLMTFFHNFIIFYGNFTLELFLFSLPVFFFKCVRDTLKKRMHTFIFSNIQIVQYNLWCSSILPLKPVRLEPLNEEKMSLPKKKLMQSTSTMLYITYILHLKLH